MRHLITLDSRDAMASVSLATTTKKCATCGRWSGARKHNADATQVEFDNAEAAGICNGGPWDGSVRDSLTRCGRWIIWEIK